MPPRRDPFSPDFDDLEHQLGSLRARKKYYEDYRKHAESERQLRRELYPTARGIPNLIIGGKTVPIDRFPCHLGIQGVTRSGKSHLMNILIKSIFEAYTAEIYRSKNIIILDSKNDYIPWVRPLAAANDVEFRVIKFGSSDSYCLDIASLVGNDITLMTNLAKTLLPTPKDGQPFWALLGQGLIVSVIQALENSYGDCWGFHDLYDTVLVSLDEFYKLVETTPEGRAFVSRYFPEREGNENVKYGVLAEFSSTCLLAIRSATQNQKDRPPVRIKIGHPVEKYDSVLNRQRLRTGNEKKSAFTRDLVYGPRSRSVAPPRARTLTKRDSSSYRSRALYPPRVPPNECLAWHLLREGTLSK